MSVFLTVKALAEQTGWDIKTIYAYAKDEYDPLPIRYVRGRFRYGILIASEAEEWVRRNSRLYSEK